MRFGIRIGPFSVSSSTRRSRPARRNSRGQEAARSAEAEKIRAEAERVARLSPQEYREHAMAADPEWAAEVLRKEAAAQDQAAAELQRLKDELRDGGASALSHYAR